MTVAVTRKEPGAGDLRGEAGRCRDGAASRRMLALALVLEGASRKEAARAAGMDRQTLRDWVHRYNAEGLAGLRDRPRSGRKPRLIPAVGSPDGCPALGLTDGTGPSRVSEAGMRECVRAAEGATAQESIRQLSLIHI